MGLDLSKKQEMVRLQLEKRNVPTNIIMQVKSVMDVSGSIQSYFSNGTIQELYNRLIPVAMRFDDNGSLESYAFGSHAEAVPEIKPEDFDSYVNDKFLPNVSRNVLWTGTNYAAALNILYDDVAGKAPGLMGFLGKKKSLFPPTYVLFTTDGDSQDEREAEKMIKKFADKKTYIQLIGVGRGSNFHFLKELADRYDYVGFCTFRDLENTSDQVMYETLLSDELCEWIKVNGQP